LNSINIFFFNHVYSNEKKPFEKPIVLEWEK
jgi:hypothetical protein